MDNLSFTASVIHSLAWPVVVGGVAFVFRSQLRGLIGRLRKVSGGPVSAEFDDKVTAAAQATKEITMTADPKIAEAFSKAQSDPHVAVSDAWFAIHEANNRNQLRLNPDHEYVSPLRQTAVSVQEFAEAGHIDKRFAPVALQMFFLFRDAHMNPADVSPAAAQLYVEQAEVLVNALDAAT